MIGGGPVFSKQWINVVCKIFKTYFMAMAPHSSTLAWKILGMAEPGGLPSMGSHRARHD